MRIFQYYGTKISTIFTQRHVGLAVVAHFYSTSPFEKCLFLFNVVYTTIPLQEHCLTQPSQLSCEIELLYCFR